MGRKHRSSASGYYCHVINRASGKAPMFTRPRDYRAFLDILREGLDQYPVPLISFCVMSNHWHLVMGPTGTPSLSRLMHWVETTHAVRFHTHRRTVGEGPIYQGRYKAHLIEEAGGLVRTCRYVERNALTAGLVKRAQDWPWGSLAERRRIEPVLPLTGADFLSSEAWIHLVNAPMTTRELALRPLWGTPIAGRPRQEAETKVALPVDEGPDPLCGNLAQRPGTGDRQQLTSVLRGADHDQPHAHVERAEHLRLVKLPRSLKPRENRRHLPAFAIK